MKNRRSLSLIKDLRIDNIVRISGIARNILATEKDRRPGLMFSVAARRKSQVRQSAWTATFFADWEYFHTFSSRNRQSKITQCSDTADWSMIALAIGK
jgi:hypothetical protein